MAFTAKPASVPEFAVNDVVDGVSGQNNVIEPETAVKNSGFIRNEKPYRQTFNWLQRFNYLWVNYFNQFFSSSHQLKINEIIEEATDGGITIDGILLKNLIAYFDHWAEKTGGHGCAVDNSLSVTGNITCTGNIQGGVPVGSIIAWLPGYFANGSNGTYAGVAIALPDYWKECTGDALNDSDSPIFNGAGRYLPNLTDSRFLMGNTAGNAGVIGGDNSSFDHTHAFTQPSAHTITQPTFTVADHVHQ